MALAVVACALAPPLALSAPISIEPALAPGDVFASIQRGDGTAIEISAAQLWRFQQATIGSAEQRTGTPIDPPRYSACVVTLARRHEARGARRARCRKLDLGSRETAARQLLNLYWVVAELDRRRIVFTEARIAHELHAAVGSQRKYARFLRRTGLNGDDVRLNIISQLGQDAIIRQVNESVDTTELSDLEATLRQADAFDAFVKDFWERSLAATSCAAPYATLRACTQNPHAAG